MQSLSRVGCLMGLWWLMSGVVQADGVVPEPPPLPELVRPRVVEERQAFEPKLVRIPAGSFTMGCQKGRDDQSGLSCESNESPSHSMQIASFQLAAYEVTVGQFKTFVEQTGYRTSAEQDEGGLLGCGVLDADKVEYAYQAGYSWRKPGFSQTDEHPVVCISWNDAKAYVTWLKERTAKPYRLPSEAEWEYAARGGSKARDGMYFWGNDPNDACQYGNGADQTMLEGSKDMAAFFKKGGYSTFDCKDGNVFTNPVQRYQPNPIGLYGMSGNAWEWVEDCYDDSYAGAPSDSMAWTDGECSRRVLRGGSWDSSPPDLRAAIRLRREPVRRFISTGFRVALGQVSK